jgi:hypothetical protein
VGIRGIKGIGVSRQDYKVEEWEKDIAEKIASTV